MYNAANVGINVISYFYDYSGLSSFHSSFIRIHLFLMSSIFHVLCSVLCCALQDLLHYRTVGGKVKECELTLHWPEEMRFTAHGRRRLEAETRAAALACLRLKVL